MVAPAAAVGLKAVASGFAKKQGEKILAGAGRRAMGGLSGGPEGQKMGNDDLVSFAGRGGIGNPKDAKQGKIMSDQLAGEVATKGIGMLGPKGAIAAKVIETVPGGKQVVGKVVNQAVSNSPAMQVAGQLGAFRAGREAKATMGAGMKGPGLSMPGLTPPKLS